MDDFQQPQHRLTRWVQVAATLCLGAFAGFFLANLDVTPNEFPILAPLFILIAVFLVFDLLVLGIIWLIRRVGPARYAAILPKQPISNGWRAGLAGIILGLIGGAFWVTSNIWDKL